LLWDAALERLREQGYRQVVVWMLQGNRRAQRFYERRRLRLEAKRTIRIGGAEVLEDRYRLDLTDGRLHGGWFPLFRRLLGALRGPA
jgi:ribosomal protein S18 acetylase RimI-like enzyme